ncbi:PilZ domain-containing protein [Dasania sp. GY-MA-18]|uniref:PilZ domain-containing protein n=1 Tax=Dasania phycosphaerae TaxID=2950436 RepID=A0A9J6RNS1_9GAMM|nr:MULTISPECIES: PilZ domain-containing protein [Dasania]MCR8923552.1 PilZ domain-containing protein [Dasania sp. GY-MA-18]MCZ0865986.1 PilZ domain-containing protein [Dasania phycosphaerae]MCZ0869710.1 PilZ domain-containing protein [Dasania phycosphaerae]
MTASNRSYDEKRDFIRMQVNSPISISHEGSQYEGVCVDLSGTGLRISCAEPLAMGAECEVAIAPTAHGQHSFNALATVTRVEQDADQQYLIGFSIKQIL